MVAKKRQKVKDKGNVVVPKRCYQCLRHTKALKQGYIICVYHHVLAWGNSLACEDFDDVEVF